MASAKALAIACNAACERIEAWAQANVTEGLTPLPRLHRDREILRKLQLETIADWLDRAGENPAQDSTLLAARELVASGNWTKAELEALLLGDDDASNE